MNASTKFEKKNHDDRPQENMVVSVYRARVLIRIHFSSAAKDMISKVLGVLGRKKIA